MNVKIRYPKNNPEKVKKSDSMSEQKPMDSIDRRFA